MQEKNAIEINSLHHLMRNRAALQRTSIPTGIVRAQ
jgi:hypothetical protein